MKELIYVGLGGMIGSMARYGAQLIWMKLTTSSSIWSTMIVNLVGCFLIGLLAGSLLKLNTNQNLLLITGLCGGFTTFSTFAFDGMKLLKAGMYVQFSSYLLISTIGGLLLCFIGFAISNR